MMGWGAVPGPTLYMPPLSQATVSPKNTLGNQDFSTMVNCREKKTIAVDRTMTWTGTGAASEEAHNSVGVTSPATAWYLAEGSSAWDFECWLLIQNPNPSEATCNVTSVSYTHLRAHETRHDLVCRLLLEKKKKTKNYNQKTTYK